MDLTSAVAGIHDEALETAHGSALGGTGLLGHISYAVHAAEPHDVLDVNIIADEPFVARVGIYDADEAVALKAEVIEERTVLTELIAVAGIVDWRVVVAE